VWLYRSLVILSIFLNIPLVADVIQAQEPCCVVAGDANSDGLLNTGDAVYMWKMFKGDRIPIARRRGMPMPMAI